MYRRICRNHKFRTVFLWGGTVLAVSLFALASRSGFETRPVPPGPVTTVVNATSWDGSTALSGPIQTDQSPEIQKLRKRKSELEAAVAALKRQIRTVDQ